MRSLFADRGAVRFATSRRGTLGVSASIANGPMATPPAHAFWRDGIGIHQDARKGTAMLDGWCAAPVARRETLVPLLRGSKDLGTFRASGLLSR